MNRTSKRTSRMSMRRGRDEQQASKKRSASLSLWKRFSRNRPAVVALLFLIVLSIIAIVADWISPHGPMDIGVGRPFYPPSGSFFMGTDDLGRDIFSGVAHGARISLMVGFAAALTATLIGVVIGSVSGYFGGRIDYLLMKLCELFQCVPRFLLALIIVVLFGNTIWNVVIVIGVLSWPRTARVVRSQFLQLRQEEFVTAARAIGVTNARIIFRYILPNVMHAVFVTASMEVAAAIITEAGLSFLGAGDPNLMSWGRMLYNAQRFLRTAWWVAVFPGSAIFTMVLSLNLIGDGLNDALNPKLRGRRGF